MKKVFWEVIGYISLALLVVGQVTVGFDFWVGQFSYLIANMLIVIRCFAVKQDLSDKIKNVCLLAICIGVMIVKVVL